MIYSSDYPFDIFKFFLLVFLFPVNVIYRSDYPFDIFKLFSHENDYTDPNKESIKTDFNNIMKK